MEFKVVSFVDVVDIVDAVYVVDVIGSIFRVIKDIISITDKITFVELLDIQKKPICYFHESSEELAL